MPILSVIFLISFCRSLHCNPTTRIRKSSVSLAAVKACDSSGPYEVYYPKGRTESPLLTLYPVRQFRTPTPWLGSARISTRSIFRVFPAASDANIRPRVPSCSTSPWKEFSKLWVLVLLVKMSFQTERHYSLSSAVTHSDPGFAAREVAIRMDLSGRICYTSEGIEITTGTLGTSLVPFRQCNPPYFQ